jgi:type III pantothenate kinase
VLAAINVGNTWAKLGVFNQPGDLDPLEVRRIPTSTSPADYRELTHGLDGVDAYFTASVVPGATRAIDQAVTKPHQVISARDDLGVRFDGLNYHQLGADLFVNAVASRLLFGSEILNADLGTASTFCVITDGSYRGTTIVPGLEISLRALTERTALLPHVEVARLGRLIQQDTISCMQSGAYYGYLELTRGLIRRAEEEWGKLGVVLTGGIGALLHEDLTDIIDYYEPDLTLKGLSLIAAQL